MGKWIAKFKYRRYDELKNVINDIYSFHCSSCGWQTGQQGISFQYCPACGEKMENAHNPNVIPVSKLEDIKVEIKRDIERLQTYKLYVGDTKKVDLQEVFNIIDNHMNEVPNADIN